MTHDINRPLLENIVNMLSVEIQDSSLTSMNSDTPIYAGMTYPYIRLSRPLNLIEANISEYPDLVDIVNELRAHETNTLDEWRRAGLSTGQLMVCSALERAGYNNSFTDWTFKGWNNHNLLYKSSLGNEVWEYGEDWSKIAEHIRETKPSFVGIPVIYSHQWEGAKTLAHLVKMVDPSIAVGMGGSHVSELYAEALHESHADYVFINRGEESIVKVMDFLSGEGKREDIPGIAWKENGKIMATKPEYPTKVIVPDYSKADSNLYKKEFTSVGSREKNGAVAYPVFTLGCDTNCTFCGIPYQMGKLSWKDYAAINAELSSLKRNGFASIQDNSDNLMHFPSKAMKLFDILKNYDFKLYQEGGMANYILVGLLPGSSVWKKELRQKAVYPGLKESLEQGLDINKFYDSMWEAGYRGFYLAVESANVKSLKKSNKPQVNAFQKETLEVVKLAAEKGFKVTIGLINGLHGETKEDMEKNVEYAVELKKAGAAFINPFCYSLLPNSPDYKRYESMAAKTDTTNHYTHEFGMPINPNLKGIELMKYADLVTMMRVKQLIAANGMETYLKSRQIETWVT